MTGHSPHEFTSITGQDWRALGFYHELDSAGHCRRLCGSRSALIGFARLVARYVETSATSPNARPLALGPYGDLQIRLWERAGIDDESIYGSSDDLLRLAQLVETRLADAASGTEVSIGPEYAWDAECSLVFEVKDDDFDPAAAVTPVRVENSVPAPAVVSPRVPFTFHDPEDREWEGLVHLEADDLMIQYEKKETLWDRVTAFFGAERPGVRDLVVPLSDVTLARFKRGVFGSNLTLQVSDIRLLEGVPRTKAGTMRLKFRRADRDAAADLASAIDQVLAQSRS